MAITETARLERETEETRAQLEQTLGELRARMSPGQILDQATGYFRHNGGRAYLSNLRDEVMHNPVPVALIGAGIAWLAISGAMGRRHSNGNGRAHMERDWGETAAVARDLSHGDRPASAAQRAHQTAEGWVHDASDAMSGTAENWREGASEMGERVSTAYDETIGRARETAGEWTEEARSAAHRAGQTFQEGMESAREEAGHLRDRASGMYERTAGGVRRAAGKARHYGRAVRHAVEPGGPLVNFCREQPMLVAGLGIAIGAALGAMIPASRTETRVMGDTSRNMKNRVRDVAEETLHTFTGEKSDRSERTPAGPETSATTKDATTEFERHIRQQDDSSNAESQPQSAAPYAEAAEAGSAAPNEPVPGDEVKPGS